MRECVSLLWVMEMYAGNTHRNRKKRQVVMAQ